MGDSREGCSDRGQGPGRSDAQTGRREEQLAEPLTGHLGLDIRHHRTRREAFDPDPIERGLVPQDHEPRTVLEPSQPRLQGKDVGEDVDDRLIAQDVVVASELAGVETPELDREPLKVGSVSRFEVAVDVERGEARPGDPVIEVMA